jgi:hypothetical protein
VTIQLRYLQTLMEVSNNQSSTIVFPLPVDVLQPLVAAAQRRGIGAADGPERARLDEALAAAREALDAANRGRERLEPGAQPLPVSRASEPAT